MAGENLTWPGYFLDLRTVRVGEAVLRDGDAWLKFSRPSQILIALEPKDVSRVLCDAERFRHGWAVGFVSYEAASAFDPALQAGPASSPLAWFALYENAPQRFRELLPLGVPTVTLQEPTLTPEAYGVRFSAARESLQRGDLYQVNLTLRQPFEVEDGPAFFADRCGVNPPPFATYINGGEFTVASFSPELFFERQGETITCRPMKGTQPIHGDPAALLEDPKSRAENVMIVDMVRNDLGRIARPGTVKVPSLLQVERHRGLQQMTTTVTAEATVGLDAVFRALFPAASITGAPKVAACRRISELEDGPRGIYCGAIGCLSPFGDRFSVGIRTAWMEDGQGVFGVGSGVVWDSQAAPEYEECLSKRDLLLHSGATWGLIESMPTAALTHPEILDAHLERLKTSVAFFGVPLDEAGIRAALPKVAPAKGKIRLEVSLDGSFTVEVGPSAIQSSRLRAVLAAEPVDESDPNLRHKTTSRAVYTRHLEAHPGADEVLLYNRRGQLTEFCRGNVVLQLNGQRLTPPPELGCLPGIGVELALRHGTLGYASLTLDDLDRAEAVFFLNSTVGVIPVDLSHA